MKGRITFLGKGFGFIRVEGRNGDLFFHCTELKNVNFPDLNIGNILSFEGISQTQKGEAANGLSLA